MGGVNDYSSTPASNTSLNGIAITDSMVPNTIDNAFRQIQADARTHAEDTGGKNVSAGTDTITLATSSGVTGYYDGLRLTFIAGGTNTGPATLNVDSVGAKAVRKGADAALVAGDITAAMPVDVVYDASANSAAGAFMLLNPYPGAYQPLDTDLTTLASAFTTASASGAASLKFAEDTDNGSNAVTLQGAESTADVTVTLPSTTGTLALTSNLVGKHTVGVAAGGLAPLTTAGCASVAQAETTTNKINYKYLAFDASTEEKAFFWMPSPKSYNASTVTMRAVWTHPSTTTNFAVVWEFEIFAVANDDALDTAVGTAVTVTDTGGTTQDFYTSDASGAVTPSNTAAKQDWFYVQVSRKAADAADTLAVDAHLIGLELYYTTDAATDD